MRVVVSNDDIDGIAFIRNSSRLEEHERNTVLAKATKLQVITTLEHEGSRPLPFRRFNASNLNILSL
jgi:hypothetical protein